jgi:hypothetical protein
MPVMDSLSPMQFEQHAVPRKEGKSGVVMKDGEQIVAQAYAIDPDKLCPQLHHHESNADETGRPLPLSFVKNPQQFGFPT